VKLSVDITSLLCNLGRVESNAARGGRYVVCFMTVTLL
jgi:hypothetical protein